jgi:hypothetical protein
MMGAPSPLPRARGLFNKSVAIKLPKFTNSYPKSGGGRACTKNRDWHAVWGGLGLSGFCSCNVRLCELFAGFDGLLSGFLSI